MFTVGVRTDQPLQLSARCDSEAASIQSMARREPLRDGTYLFCTVTLFKVFLNIIILVSNELRDLEGAI